MKILWNLLCQYNNIYANLYKYLKHKPIIGKKKTLGTVATVQNMGKKKAVAHETKCTV